jgi:large-conductance mechanosensitive channel
MTRLVDLAQGLVIAAAFPALAYVFFRALTEV